MCQVLVQPEAAFICRLFCCCGADSLCDGGRRDLLQVLHAPLLQELQDGGRLRTHRDVGHEGQVLDQTHSVTLEQSKRWSSSCQQLRPDQWWVQRVGGVTSGVSAGHTIPHSVLCSCRGLASLPSLPMGELTLRRWDSVEAKVRRFNTCRAEQRRLKTSRTSRIRRTQWDQARPAGPDVSPETLLLAPGEPSSRHPSSLWPAST